jgi:general secretion pathway protein F
MASFRYRGVAAGGALTSGALDAGSAADALVRLRRLGIVPVAVDAMASAPVAAAGAKARLATTKVISELAVLVNAELSLDRALALALENIDHAPVRAVFADVLGQVREGVPLARAMARHPALFAPMAQAMVEAGEANGRLGDALARLAATLERSEELRALIAAAMIYPMALGIIAVGVILLMLLFVVPQFESVFASVPAAQLPAASRLVMGASQGLRAYGWLLLGLVVALVFAVRLWLRQPGVARVFDRWVLRLPQIGTLVVHSQTAQFARTLSVLVEGGVALPQALAMAQRSLGNTHLADSVARVASGLKEGGGLTAPLAAANVFPRLAIGFFRTGEETSQLAPMLGRLADVLDRDVRNRLQTLIGWLTPALTVVLGASVAGIIAAVMTAILGFNDLAVG